jgi:hypothetical protein
MKLAPSHNSSAGKRVGGFTVVELMIGLLLGSLMLAFAGSMWLFGSRSFAAMANYTDLDAKSRNALDLMSRDIREASRVTAFQNNGNTKWFTVTNATAGETITYTWNAKPRTLVCKKTGQPDQVYLTGCDRWDFELYQRSPQTNGAFVFFPATNTSGVCDPGVCKLINMSWKCSRAILGSKVNTESVQTAQVVLRNKQ